MSKILIIDDEVSIRTTLANILHDEGHAATLCGSGEEAIAQFAREEFDLVILDLWLPGIDGMTVLERLRGAGAPPVIVISGHGNVDSAVRATRLGAYDFLEKPLSLERVLLTFTDAREDRKGKFELADGGTLFLDEVGDMSLEAQAKMLRVLQEQTFQKVGGQQPITVDVRVIAATNKNLDAEIAAGTFRSDLFYRLNVIPLEMPPLRERGNDVVLLAEYFLRRFAAESGMPHKRLSAGAKSKLRAYHWPGNVRELRNVIERIAILGKSETIEPEDIHLGTRTAAVPSEVDARLTLKEARDEFEKQYILSKLRELAGNVSRTADALGVERSNLYRKLHAYGIRVERP